MLNRKWSPNYRPKETRHKEIAPGSLEEKLERGDVSSLAIVERRDAYKLSPKRSKLRKGANVILPVLAQYCGSRITSYQDIEKNCKPESMGVNQFRLIVCSLWAYGYLEKYARGKWSEMWKGEKKGEIRWEKRGKKGKYYGVHYKVLKGKLDEVDARYC